MAWVTGQERQIEKRGILILSEEERSAHFLRIDCAVIQLPYTNKQNLQYNPPTEYFGTYTLNNGAYTVQGKHIVFRLQNLEIFDRKIDQHGDIVSSYFETALQLLIGIYPRLSNPATIIYEPGDPIKRVKLPIESLKFVLLDGCVVRVTTTYLEFEARENSLTTEEIPAPPPPPDNPPDNPPPPNAPPTTAPPGWGDGFIVISPPYDGEDDNGDTYVPPSPPPDEDNPTTDDGSAWMVTLHVRWENADGSIYGGLGEYDTSTVIYGRFLGIENEMGAGSGYPTKKIYAKYRRIPGALVQKSQFSGETTGEGIFAVWSVVSITRP